MKVGRNNLDRKIFALKDFRGVDYASSPLEVQPYRATDMANLLLRDGMLRKRYGFRQVFKVPGLGDKPSSILDGEETVKVHKSSYADYFVIQEKDPDRGVPIFHLMRHWYGVIEHVKTVTFGGYIGRLGTAVNIGGETYIFGGGMYRYKPFDGTIEEVKDFYIPTTTINIPFSRYSVETLRLETDNLVAFPYTSNESVNMLTNVVRNKFVARAGTFAQSENAVGVSYFKLDGSIPKVYEGGFTTGYSLPMLKTATGDDGALEQKGVFVVRNTEELLTEKGINIDLVYDDYCWYNETAGLALCKYNRTAEVNEAESNYSVLIKVDDEAFNKFLATAGEAGFADDKGNAYKEFILEYPNDNLGDTKNDILSCTCATTFGVDGANDRIFLGGGSKANMVYISENDINLKPDPTYFPADSFLVCGMGYSPISGFMRVTDGTLAIFKDVSDANDVAVYYTSGYYIDVGTGEEGNTYKQARFTVKAGDISRRGISARGISNLDGDNIFVSEEGVYGIQLSTNVASGERYAKERSRTINPKIKWLGLKDSKSIVFEDKYFLAVDGGEVYVADARYKYSLKGDQQDTFNYEWFRLTGLYVKEWFSIGDKLYFIDEDGYICEFLESKTTQYALSTIDGTLTVGEDVVTFDTEYLDIIKASAYAVDMEGRRWALLLNEAEDGLWIPSNIKISTNDSLQLVFHAPIPAAYADQYIVSSVNNELTVNDTTVTFHKDRLKLIKKSACALDDKGRMWQLRLTDDETAIHIPEDIEIEAGSSLTLWFCVPIPAYWQSSVLRLDSAMYRKNMWALSVTAESAHGGMLNLGYKTRLNAVNDIEIEGLNAQDAGDLTFIGGEVKSSISMGKNAFGMYTFDIGGHVGINTYRRRVFERDFVHIQLLFTSETINDCAVSELDIEYAISKKNIGVG